MKKIILISLLFLLTGCYDYKEINDLAIISAIGIDYKDGEYVITLEVLNDQNDKDSSKIKTYTKTSSNKSLAKALEETADLLSDQANYSHVKLMILGENIVDGRFETIVDYFTRSTYFRENFYVLSSLDTEPKKILENTTDENPIASTAIINMLESLNYSSNNSVLKTFDQIIEETLAFGKDTCFSNITLDDEQFKIDGLAIFDKYEFKSKLDNDYATIYNILSGNFYRPIFSKEYDYLYFSIAIGEGKVEIDVDTNTITLSGNLTGKIMDNEPNFTIRNLDTLEKLNNDFQKLINKKLDEFIRIVQENKSDILFLAESYYQDKRIKEENFWVNLDIESDVAFYINKKGLIYEVQDEN